MVRENEMNNKTKTIMDVFKHMEACKLSCKITIITNMDYIKSNNKIFDSWGITSGLQQALVDKNVISGLRFTKKVININTLQDLIYANSYVLKNITKQKNFIDSNSKIDVNAKIGPNVSIGKNSVINSQTSISNSIIMNDVIVERGASIKNSVIYNKNIVTQNSNIINQIII